MVTLFGGEKGGTGKSTLATNVAVSLALNGADVLLIDTDPQGSSSSWAAIRESCPELPTIHCITKVGDVTGAIRDLSKRYNQVIVDAGGKDSRELRSAMIAADRLCVPIKASQFDLWTIEKMNELVDLARGFNPLLMAFTVLSMAPTNPQINEARDAEEMLSSFENLTLLAAVIRERKAYRDATLTGRGVCELSNVRATAEIKALVACLFSRELSKASRKSNSATNVAAGAQNGF